MISGYFDSYSLIMLAVLSVEASSWISISIGNVVFCIRKPSIAWAINCSWLNVYKKYLLKALSYQLYFDFRVHYSYQLIQYFLKYWIVHFPFHIFRHLDIRISHGITQISFSSANVIQVWCLWWLCRVVNHFEFFPRRIERLDNFTIQNFQHIYLCSNSPNPFLFIGCFCYVIFSSK